MLFKTKVLEDMWTSIREYFTSKKEDFKTDDTAKRKEAKKLIEYYDGKQKEYLTGHGFEDNETGKDLIAKMTLNITRKIIDKVSMVYKYPPTRVLTDKEGKETEKDASLYAQWIEYIDIFDNYITQAERQKNLFHKVLWRNAFNPISKKWRFMIEWDYIAHCMKDDPVMPVGFSIPVFIANDNLKQQHKTKGDKDQIYLYYDDEHYFYWNTNGQTWTYYYDHEGKDQDQEGVNAFGVSPFVELRKSVPVYTYNVPGAIDLISANESININLNNLNMALHYQAFGVIWDNSGLGKEAGNKILVGPNRQTHVPEDVTLNNLDLNPKLNEMIETIKFEVQAIANTYNISVNWHNEATPVSGFSLIVQNMDYIEQRQKDVDTAKMQEKQIFKSIRAQQDYYKRNNYLDKEEPTIPLDRKLKIDFQELDLPINRVEDIAIKKYKIEQNIMTPIDEIKADNPDMTDEMAAEKYEENKKINKKYGFGDAIKERITKLGGNIEE